MRTCKPDRLKAAVTEEDVVGMVREYLGEWLPGELALLPADCRPNKIRDSQDINELAFAVTRARFGFVGAVHTAELILEMETFLAHACIRIAEIGMYARSQVQSRENAA